MEQKLKSAITRRKILSSADYEFADKGLSAARVDEISARAGVNKQLIYAHFKSKELLYKAVLEDVYARLGICEQSLAETKFEGAQTIKKIILEYFNFLAENPSFVRLMLWENLNYAKNSDALHTTLFFGIRKLLREAVDDGKIRADLDVDQIVLSINMFCFSTFSNIYTVSHLLGKDLSQKAELDKRAAHITDIITEYIFKGAE